VQLPGGRPGTGVGGFASDCAQFSLSQRKRSGMREYGCYDTAHVNCDFRCFGQAIFTSDCPSSTAEPTAV
jgi:hypothetical protein